MERVFFLDITEELKVRLGFAVWLKRLAEKCGLQIHFSPSVIKINAGVRNVISAGVPAVYSSFFAAIIDKRMLIRDKNLVDFIDTLETSSVGEDEHEFTFVFDPLKVGNKNKFMSYYQHSWQEAIADFLGCEVVRSDDAGDRFQFELRHRQEDLFIGFLGKGNARIVIDSFIPFVVDGISGYLLKEEARLDNRFGNFFISKEPVLASDGYEYDDED